MKTYSILAVAVATVACNRTTAQPDPPAPPPTSSASASLAALNDELSTQDKDSAVAKMAHFRPLCDDKGYPLVGNVNSKGGPQGGDQRDDVLRGGSREEMIFELDALGGMWAKRLATRRAATDDLSFEDIATESTPELREAARAVWTRSAFSEYASGASFAAIATALLASRAPIDLVAAAGDFVADEMFHAELASRVASALGGAVPLEVDLAKLVRPPESEQPLLRAAELVVRTCCVGEALTVPMLKQSRRNAGSKTIEAVIVRILRDEAQHAELGWSFLEWAIEDIDSVGRAHLERVATAALASFAPIFEAECASSGLGALDCDGFDDAFRRSVRESVIGPLAAHGLIVSDPLSPRS